jgi:hypothetical protein
MKRILLISFISLAITGLVIWLTMKAHRDEHQAQLEREKSNAQYQEWQEMYDQRQTNMNHEKRQIEKRP